MKRFQKQLPLQTARTRAKDMLNEEKLLDETGAIMENLQQNSLFQFAQQMFASTNCNRTTEYASTVVHRLCDKACEARNICLNWYLHVVQAG